MTKAILLLITSALLSGCEFKVSHRHPPKPIESHSQLFRSYDKELDVVCWATNTTHGLSCLPMGMVREYRAIRSGRVRTRAANSCLIEFEDRERVVAAGSR